MLKVKFNIIDGCNYSRSDEIQEKIFKDENDLNNYIESMWRGMYEIHIIKKELITEE